MQLLKHFKELTIRPKNAIELKGLILQLAVQGKLTNVWRKENPSVPSSVDLIKRIKEFNENKLRLNNRRVKKLKIENDVTLDLPNGWVQVRNFELFSLQKGRNPKDLSETVKKYAYQDIEALDRGNVRRYSNDENAPRCTSEDILVVCDGSRSGLVLEGKEGIVGSTLAIIETPPFIKQYIKIIFLQDYQRANTNMIGAAIPHLDTKNLLQEAIGLPPLEEQKAIVDVVETLFKEVEQLEQLSVERITLKEKFVASALSQLTTKNAKKEWDFLQEHFNSFFNETANIKKLRETVLQLAVQGKLTADWRANNPDIEDASILLKRIQKEKDQLIKDKKIKKEKPLPQITNEEIPYELPDCWVWCRVGEVTDIIAGASFKSGDFNETGGVKCIKITNAGVRDFVETNDYLPKSFIELYPSYLIKEGDLILALTRPYIKDGLKISVCPTSYHNSLLNQRVASIRSMSEEMYHPYIFSFIQSPKVLKYYKAKFDGKSQQPNMKMGDITELAISLPPLQEQKAIVQKVNALMVLCDALEQQVQQSQEQSEQLMQSCLREVFEG